MGDRQNGTSIHHVAPGTGCRALCAAVPAGCSNFFKEKGQTNSVPAVWWLKPRSRAQRWCCWLPARMDRQRQHSQDEQKQASVTLAWEQASFSKGGAVAAPASSWWSHSADSLKNRAVSKGSQLAFNWPKMNLNEIITGLLSKFKSD